VILSLIDCLQAHPRVAQKLKFLIKTWAEMKEFKDDAALK